MTGKRLLLCDCERTMRLDSVLVAGAGETPRIHHQLCRAEVGSFRAVVAEGTPCLVACTQEAPLFAALRDEAAPDTALDFVNLRERAGWSDEGDRAGPKIAALLAEAMLPATPPHAVAMSSAGRLLILGRDETAIAAAEKVAGRLDVSVLLTGEAEVLPPGRTRFPIHRGLVASASGHLGAFALRIDGFAAAVPSSRDRLAFAAGADGTSLDCDLILDLSGGAPLFPGGEKRDGYFRRDPGSPAAVTDALLALVDLVGDFDKPRYVDYDRAICAHGRSRKTGCTRCLDLCPMGAIAPDGDGVVVDAHVCAGCGACAGVCPTGAVAYALPEPATLLARLRALLTTYRRHGGREPVLLIHDGGRGEETVFAVARYGRGLPANVLPVAVNAPAQVGTDAYLSAFAWGAARIVVLLDPADAEARAPLEQHVALAEAVTAGLGYGSGRLVLNDARDPLVLDRFLHELTRPEGASHADFHALGRKREIERMALEAIHAAAPASVDILPLPAGAPFGEVVVGEGCTMCLACVGACPTGALVDDPDRPRLSLIEVDCVQCGLCRTTCPENVITLEPRLDFRPEARTPRVLKEEEPFACIRCGKAFGVRSSVERIVEKLQAHAMFADPGALDRIRMCEDCRVRVQFEAPQPMAAGARPRTRTTDDYLAARNAGKGGPNDGEG